MYSVPNMKVDRGLGFDFTGIASGFADLTKAALPLGLSLFQNQQQLKAARNYNQATQANIAAMHKIEEEQYKREQALVGQGGGRFPQQRSSMMSSSGIWTVGAIGAVLVAGFLVYKYVMK